MWKPGRKKNEPPLSEKAPGGAGDFEAVAEQVSAPEPPPPAPEGAEPVPERMLVRDEWAQESVRFCFYVPARAYRDSRWLLTQEESERARPQMQKFLQAVLDRYMPTLMGQLAARHPEVLDLLVAMTALTWYKWRQVQRLRREEIKEKRVEPPKPGPTQRSEGSHEKPS